MQKTQPSGPEALQSDETLRGCWQVVHLGSQDEYIDQAKLMEWLNRVIAEKKLQRKMSQLNLSEQIERYLKEIHQLDPNSVSDVQFKYEEAVEFYVWVTGGAPQQANQQASGDQIDKFKIPGKGRASKQSLGVVDEQQNQAVTKSPRQPIKNVDKEQVVDKKGGDNKQAQAKIGQKNKSPRKDDDSGAEQKIIKASEQNNQKLKLKLGPQKQLKKRISVQKVKQSAAQQQNYLYPAGKKSPSKPNLSPRLSRDQQQEKPKEKERQREHQEPEQNEFVEPEELGSSKPQAEAAVSRHYPEYLGIVFEHYCKLTYATGNDPTFEQIQAKAQVMTINKFMIFCKEFDVMKLNGMTRGVLVEIFKKNSEYFKEMSFDQFVTVLLRISFMVYGGEESKLKKEQQKQTSKQFEQFLLYLGVNSLEAFKKKVSALSIAFRPRVPQGQQKKLIQYSKIKRQDTKNSEEAGKNRGQFSEKKRIKSEQKIKPATNLPKNVPVHKNLNRLPEPNDRTQTKSVQAVKKLPPPIPPKRVSTKQRPKMQIAQDPSLVGVTGYANIHRLKTLGKQGQVESKMRLNSIVEAAKNMIEMGEPDYEENVGLGRGTPYSNYQPGYNYLQEVNPRDMVQSEQAESRQSYLDSPIKRRPYVPHGHSQLEKAQRQNSEPEDLNSIIGGSDDEDQFLQEHLNRERRTSHISQRISEKIKQFGLKQKL